MMYVAGVPRVLSVPYTAWTPAGADEPVAGSDGDMFSTARDENGTAAG